MGIELRAWLRRFTRFRDELQVPEFMDDPERMSPEQPDKCLYEVMKIQQAIERVTRRSARLLWIGSLNLSEWRIRQSWFRWRPLVPYRILPTTLTGPGATCYPGVDLFLYPSDRSSSQFYGFRELVRSDQTPYCRS